MVDMTDAPASPPPPPPVAPAQSNDWNCASANSHAPWPFGRPGYKPCYIPAYGTSWNRPRLLTEGAAPPEEECRGRSPIPGLDDEDDDDQLSAPTSSLEHQKMVDDLCDWLARARIFDGDLCDWLARLKPCDDVPVTRAHLGPQDLLGWEGKTCGNSSLKRKTSDRSEHVPEMKRRHAAPQEKPKPKAKDKKPRGAKRPTGTLSATVARKQDVVADDDTDAKGTKLQSPEKVVEKPTMLTSSPVIAAHGSDIQITTSTNDARQNDATVDVAPATNVQSENQEAAAPSIVSASYGTVLSALNGSVVRLDGRVFLVTLRMKTPSEAASLTNEAQKTQATPMKPVPMFAVAMKCNQIKTAEASSSSSSMIKCDMGFLSPRNVMTSSPPMAARYTRKAASTQQALLVLVYLELYVFMVDMCRVIEWLVCRFVPAVSKKLVHIVVNLVKAGPGAKVAPRVLVDIIGRATESCAVVDYLRKFKGAIPEVWLPSIKSYLRTVRTSKELLGKECGDIVRDAWVIDPMRLDRFPSHKTASKSEKAFQRNDLPTTRRILCDPASSKSVGAHFKAFEEVMRQWVEEGTSKRNTNVLFGRAGKAGWTEARCRYAGFMHWAWDSAPGSLRNACKKSFR